MAFDTSFNFCLLPSNDSILFILKQIMILCLFSLSRPNSSHGNFIITTSLRSTEIFVRLYWHRHITILNVMCLRSKPPHATAFLIRISYVARFEFLIVISRIFCVLGFYLRKNWLVPRNRPPPLPLTCFKCTVLACTFSV
jgi:hypothetical protein